MGKQTSQGKLVVLVPAPFEGHTSPMLQLGTALHSRGLSIVIAHAELYSPIPSHNPEFIFLPFSDNLANNDDSGSGSAVPILRALNLNSRLPLQQLLSQLMEDQGSNNQVSCIIYDSVMSFSEAVAHHLKIPSLMLHTANALSLLIYNTIPRLHAEGYFPVQDSMNLDCIPGLHPLRFKDLDYFYETLEDSLELCELFGKIRTSVAIILNTDGYLEHSVVSELKKNYQAPLFSVGPLHKMVPPSSSSLLAVDTSCIPWLDKQAPKSVLYVSCGSLVTMEQKELVEMAWGLANSNQPFLWVVRPGSINGSEWIELLPKGFHEIVGERGHIVKWAPQREVLSHHAVGGFWSHCGWNSTLESISEGVPIICRPFVADQKLTSRYLSYEWKIGLEFDGLLERGEIERAVRRLMQDKEGLEMRKRATDIKERLNVSTSQDGSSYRALNELAELILLLSYQKEHAMI